MENTSSKWSSIDEKSTVIFKVLLRLAILAFAVFVLMVIINGVRKKAPVVHTFEVPSSWEDAGLNGNTIARMIVDEVEDIKQIVGSVKEDSVTLESSEGLDLEVNVMGVGLSLNSLSYYLKSLLNIPSPSISGEIVELDDMILLTIRMSGHSPVIHHFSTNGLDRKKVIDQTIRHGGLSIIRTMDPYRVAVYYYRNKQNEKSLDVIKEIINDNQKDIQWAYLAWSNLLKEQGKNITAKKKLFKALEIDPKFTLAYKNLAWDAFQEKKYDESLGYFSKVTEIDPRDASSYHGMAQIYRAKEDYNRAEDSFRRALEIDPGVSWYYLNLGNMKLFQQKDTIGAMKLFDEARKISKDPVQLNFALVNLLNAQGRMDSAKSVILEILEFDEDNVFALSAMPAIYYSDSAYYESIEAGHLFIEQADTIHADANYHIQRVYNTMAMAYYQVDQFDQSIEYARKSIQRDPKQAYPYTSLAEAYWYSGKPKQFYEQITKAFEMGLKFESIKDDPPYNALLQNPRFKEIYGQYQLKG